MATIVSADTMIVAKGGRTRAFIRIRDANGQLVDPASLSVVFKRGERTTAAYESPINNEIVKTTVGTFYVEICPPETDRSGDLTLLWNTELEVGEEVQTVLQVIRIVDVTVLSKIPDFRLLIDKSRKLVDPSQDTFLGYTDANLLAYLEAGLGTINAYQPGGVAWTLTNYPWKSYAQLLFESALVIGVMSQTLYAVDTDIPNYNDQGTSFTIQHQPALAAYLNQISQRLDKLIPQMKLNFVSSGSIHVQMGGTYRNQVLLDAAPNGALFRNIMFKG